MDSKREDVVSIFFISQVYKGNSQLLIHILTLPQIAVFSLIKIKLRIHNNIFKQTSQ